MKICFFGLLLLPLLAYPRWATYEDAPSKVNNFTRVATINADGTLETEVTDETEVLKEAGREGATAQRLHYNENAQKITILEAYTVTDGKKYAVDLKTIEDKPLASEGPGFDQINQILIVFPHVKVGSKVHLKYKSHIKKVPLDNVFSQALFYGEGYYWEKSKDTIRSEIPLKIKINDPLHALEVKNTKKGKWQEIVIKQKKPLYTDTINDGDWVNYDQLTWVSVSSLDKWEDISRLFAEGWEKILAQPLPTRFDSIIQNARKKKSEVDQINTVTSLLSESLQYMGDWRTVEGKCWPRSFQQIADTHLGDCKDFSAVTVAILRTLGFQAHVVLVNRGLDARDFDSALPFSDANHAMVKVIGKSGKVYWVDPTNTVSMAQGLFPDIVGKRAFVLNLQNPTCEQIPEIDPSKNEVVLERTISLGEDRSIDVTGKATFKGESALEWAGKGLAFSPKRTEEEVIKAAVEGVLDKEDKRTVEIPDLTKRIVEDLTFKYAYQQQHMVTRTNKGYYLGLSPLFSLVTAEDQISDMFLGSYPVMVKKVRLIKEKKVENIETLNAEIKTPWMDIKRVCTKEKDHVRVEDVLILKTKFIPAKDLKGSVYKNLVKDLKRYFDVGIVFEAD